MLTAIDIDVLGTLMASPAPLLALEVAARTRISEAAVLDVLRGLGDRVSCTGSLWTVVDRQRACEEVNATRRALAFSSAFSGLRRQRDIASALGGQAGA